MCLKLSKIPRDFIGRTQLHLAAKNGHTEVVMFIILCSKLSKNPRDLLQLNSVTRHFILVGQKLVEKVKCDRYILNNVIFSISQLIQM